MLTIDGSCLEGGGAILRMATAISALTGEVCVIENIRKGRDQPGLKHQHLKSLEAITELCDAETKGLKLHSKKIVFKPNKILAKKLDVDIVTAGSIPLLLQNVMPLALKAKDDIKLKIIGGTNTKWSPTIDYLKGVNLPVLKKFGYDSKIKVIKRGYYPKGGGVIEAVLKPSSLSPIEVMEREDIKEISGISTASMNLKKTNVVERQVDSAEKVLKQHFSCPVNIDSVYEKIPSTGTSIDLQLITNNTIIGSNALGEVGKRAETVGEEAAHNLIRQRGALDEYMEDQIILYMGYSTYKNKKESRIRVGKLTEHTKTNIWVVEQFLSVKFSVAKDVIVCYST